MKKYYLIKYSSQNCFEAYIVNEKNYKHLKEKLEVDLYGTSYKR